MPSKTKAIPEGFHTLTPHLTVRDAKGAIDFYQKALGAEVLGVHNGPDGKVMHAALRIGDSILMLNDEYPEFGSHAPKDGVVGFAINIYTDDVDKLWDRATKAGATVKMPLQDQFWGDRYGQVQDPYGFRWALGQHVRDVSPAEMEKASQEAMRKMPKSA
jgi:uncharacterized glyoxalase superfamily protein PhnB